MSSMRAIKSKYYLLVKIFFEDELETQYESSNNISQNIAILFVKNSFKLTRKNVSHTIYYTLPE